MAAPTVEALLTAAAALPLAHRRCPGTFLFELKDQRCVWVLQLTPGACRAFAQPADAALPPRECHVSYKTADVFLALHVTKTADARQQFLRGGVAIKGDFRFLGSIQGLLDEAYARLQPDEGVPTPAEGPSAPAAEPSLASPLASPEALHVRVLCSQVVRDTGGGVFQDLADKKHVEYVVACSPTPFQPPSTEPPPAILGGSDHRPVVRYRPRTTSSVPAGGWTVRHRFSDFLDLHQSLKRCGPVSQTLPPKTFFGGPSVRVVRERERRLEGYLQGVLAAGNPAQKRLLWQFLQADHPRLTAPPPTPTTLAAESASPEREPQPPVPSPLVPGPTAVAAPQPDSELTESDTAEALEALEGLRAEVKALEDRCREFQRQSFNGFAVLLLALARVLHGTFTLACTVAGIALFYTLVTLAIHVTHLGGTPAPHCQAPDGTAYAYSAWVLGHTTAIVAPVGRPLTALAPNTPAMLTSVWGRLWPTLCPGLPHVGWVSVVLGLPAAAVVHSIFQRRILVFISAGMVLFSFKLVRLHSSRLTSQDSDDLWEYVLRVYAVFIYRSILRLKGMWVKTGQYIGSRSDVMPQPIIDEFVKLQDAVPPTPFGQIKETIEDSLKCTLTDIFVDFEEDALAAASIAQVHVAKLKDGRKVVVKVQHARVRELMLEDLWSLWVIVRFVAWAEPEYDFRPIMEEWIKHVEMELDFTWEVRNLKRAHAAMAASGLDVVIPLAVEEYTATRVCVMEFCPGLKVTDVRALAEVPKKEQLMEVVCQSFAYQMHMDGLFNADPHPGNILVQVEKGPGPKTVVRPVLLDWGLAKVLEDQRRLAFAKFVYCAFDRDFVGMLDAFDAIGIKLNREDPMTDMANIRFLFRDTSPPEDSRAQFKEHAKKLKQQRIEHTKNTGRKTPVDAFPGDLLFFMRVTHLMQGLGSRLRVRTPYLSIMAPFAKLALVERYPAPASPIYPSPVLSPLEQNVRTLLKELLDRELLVGCQVCVFKDGHKVVDTAAGWRGSVDRRPCRPDMVFSGQKVSSAVLASAVHLLVDRGALKYDDPVCSVWPAFGSHGKQGITVRQVLAHQAWLQHAVPDAFSVETMLDGQVMMRAIENAEPLKGAAQRSIYHPFGAWILAGLVEHVAKQPVAEFVQQEVAVALDLEREFFMGLPPDFPEESLAHLSYEFPTEMLAGAGAGGGQDGIGEMLSLGERAQNPDDLLAEDSDDGHVLQAVFKKLKGKQYLLDPRLGNHKRLRQCGVNGYFSARALAKFLDTLPYVLSPGRMQALAAIQGTDDSLLQQLFVDSRAANWGLGFQVFGFREKSAEAPRFAAIGHWGGGGTLAFTSPANQLSFAMTVNKLSRDPAATEAVVRTVLTHFGLGDFVVE